MRISVSKVAIYINLLFWLPACCANACTFGIPWFDSIDTYKEAVAVYSGKIRFMKTKNRYLYDFDDVFETDQNDTVAFIDINRYWKKKSIQIIGLNKMEQNFSEKKIIAGQNYIFFICKNKNKEITKERYTACDILEHERGTEMLQHIKSYLDGTKRYREMVLAEANNRGWAMCGRIMEE